MIILTLLLVLFMAYFLTLAQRNYALKTRFLDIPNKRSSHQAPVPTAGGIAIVCSFMAGISLQWYLGQIDDSIILALVGSGVLMSIVGYFDDRYSIKQFIRLMLHFLAAVWSIVMLEKIPSISLFGYEISNSIVIVVLVVVLLVWLLNLFNFMDGIDGLASCETMFICLAGAVYVWNLDMQDIAYLYMILASATAGFLILNWPPAKIFMGDTGSGFLGITIGILAYASILQGASLWVWLILTGVFFVDASVTLLRRMLNKEKWYRAHRNHAYQFSARRWGHQNVDLIATFINVVWLLPMAYMAAKYVEWGFIITVMAYLPLVLLVFAVSNNNYLKKTPAQN